MVLVLGMPSSDCPVTHLSILPLSHLPQSHWPCNLDKSTNSPALPHPYPYNGYETTVYRAKTQGSTTQEGPEPGTSSVRLSPPQPLHEPPFHPYLSNTQGELPAREKGKFLLTVTEFTTQDPAGPLGWSRPMGPGNGVRCTEEWYHGEAGSRGRRHTHPTPPASQQHPGHSPVT